MRSCAIIIDQTVSIIFQWKNKAKTKTFPITCTLWQEVNEKVITRWFASVKSSHQFQSSDICLEAQFLPFGCALLCCRGTHCKMSEYGEKHGGLMGRAPSHGVEHLGRHLAACVVPLHTLKIFNGYQQKLGGKPDVMVRATCTYIESSSCLKGIAILIDHWLEIKTWRDQRNPYFVRILVDIF